MPYYLRFFWTEENELHVAAHGVTMEEFEFVVLNARRADVMRSRTSDRFVVIGDTPAGRRIVCVYEEFDESCCYPVTAYDL